MFLQYFTHNIYYSLLNFLGSSYEFCPKDPPNIEAAKIGILISYAPGMMLGLLRNMRSKWIARVYFLLVVTNSSALYGRSQTIYMLREIYAIIIFMRSCLTFVFFLIEIIARFVYSLLLVHQGQAMTILDTRNEFYWYHFSFILIYRTLCFAHFSH